MVARSRGGETRAFPVVETVQKDSICHVTEAPAQVSNAARQEATRVAERAVATLEGSSSQRCKSCLWHGAYVCTLVGACSSMMMVHCCRVNRRRSQDAESCGAYHMVQAARTDKHVDLQGPACSAWRCSCSRAERCC